jgi:Flp pilus assembly protein TadG
MKLPPTAHEERGAAVIEGALILLAFLTVFFSIWEAGRLMNVQQCVTNGAREGARFAVTPLTQTSCLPTDTAIRTRVNTFLQAASINGATIAINSGNGIGTPELIPPVTGKQYTRVTVTYSYSFLSIPLLNGLTTTLHGEALMKNEALYACP